MKNPDEKINSVFEIQAVWVYEFLSWPLATKASTHPWVKVEIHATLEEIPSKLTWDVTDTTTGLLWCHTDP